ncbi:MAG: hypothetical protein AAF500_04670 [Myxococcota bacterium]
MEGAPNILSRLVFFLWVPFCLWGMKRWPPARATAAMSLVGVLILPELVTFSVPGIPDFYKPTIIVLWVFLGAVFFHRERLSSVSFPWQLKWCIGFLLVGAVFTVLLNTDPLNYGSSYVPAHRPYDIVHLLIKRILMIILPFVLGLSMFRSGAELRVLLQTFVAAALLYSILQIAEMVLSPQLNRWVYGFHQHSFAQTMRGGGFRPMVFMSHGLALAMFTTLATIAAAALHKVGAKVIDVPAKWAAGYLGAILATSRSVAALLYAFVAVPLVLFVSPRRQVFVALAIGSLLLTYPAARSLGLIPVDDINAFVLDQYGVEKVGSLTVRFENEAEMLDKALERLWFGWGWFCRACFYDPWSGALISIRDGAWIATLGNTGIIGFIGHFGLLVFPVWVLWRRISRVPKVANRRLLAALALMVGLSCFDLIPNGNFNTISLLLAGALYGSLDGLLREAALARRRRRAERARAAQEARGALAT